MAPSADNIVVAGTGSIWVAPADTPLPAALAALAAPWVDLGYTSDDGVTIGLSRDQEEIMAWQASEAVRVLITSEPKTIGFELLEFKPEAVELALRGGEIDVTTGVATLTPPAPGASDTRALVVEAIDGDKKYRFCFAAVQLTGDVEWQLVRTDATRLPLEFSVIASEAGWNIVTDDPVWAAAGAGPAGAKRAAAHSES